MVKFSSVIVGLLVKGEENQSGLYRQTGSKLYSRITFERLRGGNQALLFLPLPQIACSYLHQRLGNE